MSRHEIVSWICTASALGAVVLLLVWPDRSAELRTCEEDSADLARGVYECATGLQAANETCTETARASMIRATQLFECTEEICEANGWEAPLDRWRPDPMEIEFAKDPIEKTGP